jgi:uncharacterized protein YjdB
MYGSVGGAVGNGCTYLVTMNSGVANATSVRYKAHVAEKGWLGWIRDGQVAGTTGESRQIESVIIEISGLPTGGCNKIQNSFSQ